MCSRTTYGCWLADGWLQWRACKGQCRLNPMRKPASSLFSMYSANLWSGCRCRAGNSEVTTTRVGAQGRDNCDGPSACWLSKARRSFVYQYLPSVMPISLRTNPDSDPPPAGTDIMSLWYTQHACDPDSTCNATPKNKKYTHHLNERLNKITAKNETWNKIVISIIIVIINK